MDSSAKKVMVNLYYYTIALFVLLFSVLFMVSMASKALATYQAVIYYVWAGLTIVLLFADIVATVMKKYKLIVGLCIYALMVMAVIVGIIVYAALNVGGIIPAGALDIFNTLILYSGALSFGLIIVYALGIKMIDDPDLQ